MIGKSLRERYELGSLSDDRAIATMKAMVASHAKLLVEVRAQDERMIACLVVRADKPAVRLCEKLGFQLKRGGTAVFGLLGTDAARLFEERFAGARRTWLETPCGPRETKVLLIADGGIALLSIETKDGAVTITTA